MESAKVKTAINDLQAALYDYRQLSLWCWLFRRQQERILRYNLHRCLSIACKCYGDRYTYSRIDDNLADDLIVTIVVASDYVLKWACPNFRIEVWG